MIQYRTVIFILLLLLVGPGEALSEDKLVITANGPGSLPENSLPSLVVTIIREAGAVRLDAVLNKDDEVIVLRDPILNDITDVAERFPDRISEAGNYYVFDFSSAELRQLSLITTAEQQNGFGGSTKYPLPHFRIPTLEEALGLIRMLEKNLGHQIKVVVELRKNWLHREYNKDLSGNTLEVLSRYGYNTAESGAYLGSYDPEELQRINDTLLPAVDMNIKLIQLITDNDSTEHMTLERDRYRSYNYDWLFTKFGLKGVSAYADVIGLPTSALTDETGAEIHTGYLANAHLLGLKVIAYPLDLSVDSLPGFAPDSNSLIEHYLFVLGIDGLLSSDGPTVHSYLVKRSELQSMSTQQLSIERLIENAKKNGPNGNVLLNQKIQ
jgi:glycerophosphoryl diester phosphodiesterase